MNIKEKMVEKTVTVFELTEEELEKIKINERKEGQKEGRREALDYIRFAIGFYEYGSDMLGAIKFLSALLKFTKRETDVIPNAYGYSFGDFLKQRKNNIEE